MLRNVFTPLQRTKAGLWALQWWLFALAGTYLFWEPVFHFSPFMLFFTAVALTASRSGGFWGMATAMGGVLAVWSHPQIHPKLIIVPSLSMLFNSGIIIFLGATVRTGNAERREERLFRDSLGEAVADFLWSSLPDGTPLYINERMEVFFGRKRDEITREGWQSLIHPDDLPSLDRLFTECNQTAEKFSLPVRYRKDDGTYRYYLCRGVPIVNEQGKITRWVGTGTDVHEQHLAEETRESLLKREQKARLDAEDASRLKDEFLATLSHELRTPLNAVFGWMHLLRTGEPDAEELSEGLEVIDRNVRAQGQLVSDLLDMSGIITGKMRINVESVHIPDLVRHALESIRPAAEAKHISIQSALDPIAGPINGDPARLQQIIWNLLNNAVKFTPKGGEVRVILEKVESSAELLVTDNGEGIAPEFLPYIFDRFRQADSSATRAHGGLGLGLAITRQLVELHGGSITAQSEGQGRGATFQIRLPLAAISPMKDFADESGTALGGNGHRLKPASLQGARILVVDDDQDTRNLLRQILEPLAMRVVTAGSAREAIEALERNPQEAYQAIICDIGMPAVSGYDFIGQVRHMTDERRHIPALALTAFARDTDRDKALAAGFDFFISKPVEPRELISVVSLLVEKNLPNRSIA